MRREHPGSGEPEWHARPAASAITCVLSVCSVTGGVFLILPLILGAPIPMQGPVAMAVVGIAMILGCIPLLDERVVHVAIRGDRIVARSMLRTRTMTQPDVRRFRIRRSKHGWFVGIHGSRHYWPINLNEDTFIAKPGEILAALSKLCPRLIQDAFDAAHETDASP